MTRRSVNWTNQTIDNLVETLRSVWNELNRRHEAAEGGARVTLEETLLEWMESAGLAFTRTVQEALGVACPPALGDDLLSELRSPSERVRDAERLIRRAQETTEKVERYGKGPKARKTQRDNRLEEIRRLVSNGTERSPKAILKALNAEEATSHLTRKKNGKRIKPKTIAHDLAILFGRRG